MKETIQSHSLQLFARYMENDELRCQSHIPTKASSVLKSYLKTNHKLRLNTPYHVLSFKNSLNGHNMLNSSSSSTLDLFKIGPGQRSFKADIRFPEHTTNYTHDSMLRRRTHTSQTQETPTAFLQDTETQNRAISATSFSSQSIQLPNLDNSQMYISPKTCGSSSTTQHLSESSKPHTSSSSSLPSTFHTAATTVVLSSQLVSTSSFTCSTTFKSAEPQIFQSCLQHSPDMSLAHSKAKTLTCKSRASTSTKTSMLASSFPLSSLSWLCFIVLTSRLLTCHVEAATLIPQSDSGVAFEGLQLADAAKEVDGNTVEVDDYLTKFGYYKHETSSSKPSRFSSHHKHRRHHRKPRDAQWMGPLIDVYATTEFDDNIKNVEDISPVFNSVEHSQKERANALKRFQEFFNLPITGEMDEATLEIMRRPRCGLEDIKEEENDMDESDSVKTDVDLRKRQKRYAISRYGDGTLAKWQVPNLTWKITRVSSQLDESTQRRVFRESLAVWQKVMPITFREHTGRDGEDADIRIQFVRREHGPSNDPVFDGKRKTQNVLAHAWGPNIDTKGFAGDVHFDEDDDWSDAQGLKNVAVHELGHSMGLLHSKDSRAIMYPVYRNVSRLSQDDINGITAIYGGPNGVIRPDPRERPDRRRTERPTYTPEPRDRHTQRPAGRGRNVGPDPWDRRTRRPDGRGRNLTPDPWDRRTQKPQGRGRNTTPDPRGRRTRRPSGRNRNVGTDPWDRRTRRPDERGRNVTPDPWGRRTQRPEGRGRNNTPGPWDRRTQRPDGRGRNVTPGPWARRTERPDGRGRNFTPGPWDRRTQRPEGRGRNITPRPSDRRTQRPDERGRNVTPRPWDRRTQRPDERGRNVTPGPWDRRTQRPDGRGRNVTPDPLGRRTQRPDGRERETDVNTLGPYYTVRPQWVTPPPISEIDKCTDIEVDTVFVDPIETFGDVFVVISGDHLYRITSRGTVIQSQPLSSAYPQAPLDADVVFSIPRKESVYFIKENKLWAYRGNQLVKGQSISLEALKFPETPKYAITIDDHSGFSRLLLFSKNYWWSFDVDRMSMTTKIRYDPISSFSRDLPDDVKFTAKWTDGYLYAVTSDSYFILDPIRRQVIHDKPKAGKPEWLHALCESGFGPLNMYSPLVIASLILSLWFIKN